MQYEIKLVREDMTVLAEAGETLLAVEIATGLEPDAPCGGQGTCGKCLVDIMRGGKWETVKACQTRVEGPMQVRTHEKGAGVNVLISGGAKENRGTSFWAQEYELHVKPCPTGHSTSDWDRMKDALAEKTGRTDWQANTAAASQLAGICKENDGRVFAVTAGDRVLAVSDKELPVYMAAFDVGTTTIAGYLLKSGSPEPVATAGMLNPQAQYGADVIMRANYALENGAKALADCVHGAINELLTQLCGKTGIERTDIYAVSVVGNTCMHHLFLGISPQSLAHSPYNPAISEELVLRASDYGIEANPEADLLMPPVIAGFVGADTVGCLLAVDWDRLDKLTLMIDIGTNGEIVVGNRDRMIASSTAAGPAFEGAKIQCGMRGAEGAVDHVKIVDGKPVWHVIGDGKAKGICGSGLIDLIAVLHRLGEIDDGGKLLCGERYDLGDTGVFLSQRDIREVQLAKGAISAGITLLAWKLGVGLEDIEQVFIAGAFGNYMDPASACDIGLIPIELKHRITPVGNAAGAGAQMVLDREGSWSLAAGLAKQAEFLELATLPQFQDEFVDAMEFPEPED